MSENKISQHKGNKALFSFWSFLQKNKIEIPLIQRDYAQGRKGKEVLRKNFLRSLKETLNDKDNKVLTLDFVYGSKVEGKVQLLDGQQRVTTLWLLHWYIALRTLKAGSVEFEEACETLKNFSYETRTSSRDFCESLCNPENFKLFKNNDSIVDFIQKQTWFYSEWKQDPTISSMLRMLGRSEDEGENKTRDNIEKVFETKKNTKQNEYEKWWRKLTEDDIGKSPIIFYYLSLGEFRLSDDLYVKMNARGKPLTSFENLKADLIGYIKEKANQASKDTKEKWEDLAKNLPQKLDTDWTNIFWKNKYEKNGVVRIDEIYFAFINRFFLNYKIEEIKDEKDKYYLYFTGKKEDEKKSDVDIVYSSLDDYKCPSSGEIDVKFFTDLQTVLDNYAKLQGFLEEHDYENKKEFKECKDEELLGLLHCSWNRSFEFIPKYKDNDGNVSDITQPQRVIFFAVCKFLNGIGDKKICEDDITQLKRLMRVVYNLVSGKDVDGGSQINNVASMKAVVRFIDSLDSQDMYYSLAKKYHEKKNRKMDEKTPFAQRCSEEILKANKIFDTKTKKLKEYNGAFRSEEIKTWEDIIKKAENYAFFNGAIRFLFRDENGEEDWIPFDKKFSNAKKYFKESESSCLNRKYDNANLLKVLISRFGLKDFSPVLWWNYKIFNNRADSWRYYLLNLTICSPVHQILCGETDVKYRYKLSTSFNRDKNILYLLTQTDLLDFVMKNIPEAWIRNKYHGHYGIYENKKDGVFLDARKRDSFFQKNEGKVKFDKSNCVIKDKDGKLALIAGVNVCFSYNKKNYLWWEDDCIYCLDDEDKKKDISGKLCFSTKGLNDSRIIKEMLKAEHNSNKKSGEKVVKNKSKTRK